jgi:hypothetical protein
MKNPEVLAEMEKEAAKEKTVVVAGVEVKVRVFPAVRENPEFYLKRTAILAKTKRRSF